MCADISNSTSVIVFMIYWYVKKYDELFIHKRQQLEAIEREDEVSSAICQMMT